MTFLRQTWRGRLVQAVPHGDALSGGEWLWRHALVVGLLVANALALAALTIAQGYGSDHAFLEGGVVGVFALASLVPLFGRRLEAIGASVGFVVAAATLTHLMHGAWYGHAYFVLILGVVAIYRDWWPLAAAVATTVVYHGVVGALDPHSVVGTSGTAPWMWTLGHALVGALLLVVPFGRPHRLLNGRGRQVEVVWD